MPKTIINNRSFDPADEEIISKAMLLRDDNKRVEAIEILTQLEKKYANNSVFNGILGMNYRELENNKKSCFYFKRTTVLSPDKELPSVSLFNILYEMGKFKAAFNEMDRYLSKNTPNLYKVTIEEQMEQLNDKTPKYQKEILEKYKN